MVDWRHQGRGIGRAAIQALAQRRAAEGATHLLLSCTADVTGSPEPFYTTARIRAHWHGQRMGRDGDDRPDRAPAAGAWQRRVPSPSTPCESDTRTGLTRPVSGSATWCRAPSTSRESGTLREPDTVLTPRARRINACHRSSTWPRSCVEIAVVLDHVRRTREALLARRLAGDPLAGVVLVHPALLDESRARRPPGSMSTTIRRRQTRRADSRSATGSRARRRDRSSD